jgi:crotonobetainyl-CoA:carnitine CoA-transferase CaiB-like acyl-CoA transferase
VIIAAVGTVFDRVCRVLGLDPAEDKWRQAHRDLESVGGIEFDAILRGWVEERTVSQVVEIMNAAQVGCCPIMTAADTAENPHYKARSVHMEWDDISLGRKVKGTGIAPKFSETPGKIWRGSVPLGYDNERVFGKLLGLEPDDVSRLKGDSVI